MVAARPSIAAVHVTKRIGRAISVLLLLHASGSTGSFANTAPRLSGPHSSRTASPWLRPATTARIPHASAFVGETIATGAKYAFHVYEASALESPILTKAWTSGVAYLLGDTLAQKSTGPKPRKLRLGRCLRSATAGFVSHGPQLHFWCLFLDRFIDLGAGPWARRGAVVLKIALDQTIFSLYMNAAYCALIEFMKRTSPRSVWARVKASAWPTLRSSWRFWPVSPSNRVYMLCMMSARMCNCPGARHDAALCACRALHSSHAAHCLCTQAVHALTYSVVPLHLRVLWVDAVEIVWVAILATCVAAVGGVQAEEGSSGDIVADSHTIAEDAISGVIGSDIKADSNAALQLVQGNEPGATPPP